MLEWGENKALIRYTRSLFLVIEKREGSFVFKSFLKLCVFSVFCC